MNEIPKVYQYHGKDVCDMTKKELVDAVIQLGTALDFAYERDYERRRKIFELITRKAPNEIESNPRKP